ncbi:MULTISPECIES: PLP-dependent aminotransferase family protein [Brevibacillus]|uniref:aminotransferase-like domain-containing protein n=1 Tax=Brevibacillus TaxID=55080 RepID=UPI000D0F8DB8|nr:MULTISPECIES: PLP-dependent aminotransferase family protein [Brevibacillus]MED1943992.1 PLP-dependent aminotransferase family protein [Brevibacillus formosus]MED1999636.1 PLP-dependent aminotransferase family protein [Brevibacillus formosus]MED2082227.1 PLP-dependent aminotransferase family protein [Brevibacillus formosus]PSK18852.1 PLP-dependent aminotransferase family protein [Brevibacillus sp. NRRL NRS-603]
MFQDFKLVGDRPVAIQVKEYVKRLIIKGALQADQKLPSTREMSSLLKVSRNTVIAAYEGLEDDGFTYAIPGKGSYVTAMVGHLAADNEGTAWQIDWKARMNEYAISAVELDMMKQGIRAEKGTISFTSIAPDEQLFDMGDVRRAFMDRMAIEGQVLLNYGYAKGYKPLIDYLMRYMENKGVDLSGKDMLITNGFTEGFDIVLSALRPSTRRGAAICENPTHHTAIKNLKLQGFEITGIPMRNDGMDVEQLEAVLHKQNSFDLAYLTPSYHNPTGIVMSPAKRSAVMKLLMHYQIPVIEDGFNEELRYSGAHVAPLIARAGQGNGVIYIGSFSKVLFPGLRVGWVLGDKALIDNLESMKRARTIHTSTIDQSILYQYLLNGNFDKYVKKARMEYKRKYELTKACCEAHLPEAQLSGDGGLHLFLTFPSEVNTRQLLEACTEQGVIFTPGDKFFIQEGTGTNTLRLGFSRVTDENIVRGIQIIGKQARRFLET